MYGVRARSRGTTENHCNPQSVIFPLPRPDLQKRPTVVPPRARLGVRFCLLRRPDTPGEDAVLGRGSRKRDHRIRIQHRRVSSADHFAHIAHSCRSLIAITEIYIEASAFEPGFEVRGRGRRVPNPSPGETIERPRAPTHISDEPRTARPLAARRASASSTPGSRSRATRRTPCSRSRTTGSSTSRPSSATRRSPRRPSRSTSGARSATPSSRTASSRSSRTASAPGRRTAGRRGRSRTT